MRTARSTLAAVFVLLAAFCAFAVPAWAQAPATEKPLSNDDVVKLCKLDLGDEVVIAKINQAKTVDFKLETDDLAKLKQQGVSKNVIGVMLKRSTPGGGAPQGAVASTGGPGGVQTAEEGVWLRTSKGEVPLHSVQGDLSTTWAFAVVLLFLDFPSLHAEVRINDPQPTITVRSSKSPRGRVFLVKCESNKKDNTRSVKVGKASPFGMKSWSTPDSDWTVEYDMKELQAGTWEITPKSKLKAGEYGVLFRGGFAGVMGGTQGEIFDFGVD